jgi:hypothetical protein
VHGSSKFSGALKTGQALSSLYFISITYSERFPFFLTLSKSVRGPTPQVDLVKPLGFDGQGISIQQAGNATLTRFQAFILAVCTGFRIMRFVINRLFICGNVSFKVA